ncbi:MAG: hypothetical protein HC876_18250 [Chloroflexaceae bacterium]|nr:hypothetical protein [Chloroflexaceae bacterium]NJO07293.1 hypothetical protein [Chloroflexaceae bacterium]
MGGILGYIVGQTAPEVATTYRDGGAGWIVVEVMGHLLDFDTVFLERAMHTVEEDNPPLYFPPR